MACATAAASGLRRSSPGSPTPTSPTAAVRLPCTRTAATPRLLFLHLARDAAAPQGSPSSVTPSRTSSTPGTTRGKRRWEKASWRETETQRRRWQQGAPSGWGAKRENPTWVMEPSMPSMAIGMGYPVGDDFFDAVFGGTYIEYGLWYRPSVGGSLSGLDLSPIFPFCILQPNVQSRSQKEGSETEQFWSLLGGKSKYSSQKLVREQESDPHLFSCILSKGIQQMHILQFWYKKPSALMFQIFIDFSLLFHSVNVTCWGP
jgi:hypothetical protein